MIFSVSDIRTENELVPILFPNEIKLFIKREDTLHPFVSGNKYRKLKYNWKAIQPNHKQVITFGGAFSNHIAAVAAAGSITNIPTIGFIRGEELEQQPLNATLQFAVNNGMQLQFVSRTEYAQKDTETYITALQNKYPNAYIIPEGGTNEKAIKGCTEIVTPDDAGFDYICCALGTGGTFLGIQQSAFPHQKVLGYSALQHQNWESWLQPKTTANNWEVCTDYTFGGYAKVTDELVTFMNDFYQKTAIPLDPVYTGKMIFGIFDGINKGFFPPQSKIVAIHTGGLQGIEGFNDFRNKKNKSTLQFSLNLKIEK